MGVVLLPFLSSQTQQKWGMLRVWKETLDWRIFRKRMNYECFLNSLKLQSSSFIFVENVGLFSYLLALRRFGRICLLLVIHLAIRTVECWDSGIGWASLIARSRFELLDIGSQDSDLLVREPLEIETILSCSSINKQKW